MKFLLGLGLLVIVGAASSGCWHAVEDHCPGCLVLSERSVGNVPINERTRAIVILVHGAFGFGNEWRPVVDAINARSDLALGAFAWSGPFTRKPSLPAEMLLATVQRAIDSSPSTVTVVVVAHSAGGALTAYVAPRLRVPAGRQVKIVSIAGADTMRVAPFVPNESVNTPMGFAIGGVQSDERVVAKGVDYVEYKTADAPPNDKAQAGWLIGARRVYLGKRVGHNQSVGLAAVSIIRAL